MATFKSAYNNTKPYEGGFSNHPNDRGKRTYAGIAANFFPNWAGWKFLNKQTSIKHNQIFPELNPLVERFYLVNFWQALNLNSINQKTANLIYDFAVHSGKKTAIEKLQVTLNKLGAFLKVDGIIGRKTIKAILNINEQNLNQTYLEERKAYLNTIAHGSNAVFRNGWMARIKGLSEMISTNTSFIVVGGLITLAIFLAANKGG